MQDPNLKWVHIFSQHVPSDELSPQCWQLVSKSRIRSSFQMTCTEEKELGHLFRWSAHSDEMLPPLVVSGGQEQYYIITALHSFIWYCRGKSYVCYPTIYLHNFHTSYGPIRPMRFAINTLYRFWIIFWPYILSVSYFVFISCINLFFLPLWNQHADSIVPMPMCLFGSVSVNSSIQIVNNLSTICSVLGRATARQPNICKIPQSSLHSWTIVHKTKIRCYHLM